ncbi:MAG: YIP1 family protein, partial [Chloroflexi bacterium]|nr:YIP1 family protein [Chloroflexota bacterium]
MERAASSTVDRMIRAARLDVDVYEELERDTSATWQALIVVVIVAIASGVGALLAGIVRGVPSIAVSGLIGGIIAAVIGWAIWSLVTYLVGTTLFGGTASYGELLRTIGFAYTPNALQILGFIPLIGALIVILAEIWALVAGVVAVRQALDFSTGKAILTVLIGWVIMLVI